MTPPDVYKRQVIRKLRTVLPAFRRSSTRFSKAWVCSIVAWISDNLLFGRRVSCAWSTIIALLYKLSLIHICSVPQQRVITETLNSVSQVGDVSGVRGDIGGVGCHGIVSGFQLRAVYRVSAATGIPSPLSLTSM